MLPDSATLAAAGISQADAAGLVQAVQQAAMKSGRKSTGGGSISGGKPSMTYSQILNAIENGQVTDSVRSGYDYFMGSGSYDRFYGGNTGTGGEVRPDVNAVISNVNTQLTRGNTEAADGYLRSVWNGLTAQERQQVQSVLQKYGISGYQP